MALENAVARRHPRPGRLRARRAARDLQRLRDDDPVSWWAETGGSGFWAVTRYDDIVAASHDWKVFSTARGIRIEDMPDEELPRAGA